jgi:drug/metabolite transporter (DMT)-like permease
VVLPLFQKGIKTGDLTGNMLILIATFMWALYVIFSKKIIEKGYSPISVTTVSFIVATILSLLLSPFVAKSNFILPIFNLKNLFLLLILGGVATVAGQFLMQTAIKRTSATIASLNQYIQPIFVVILAGITLGEKITIEFTVGVILVFAGVFIATYSRK